MIYALQVYSDSAQQAVDALETVVEATIPLTKSGVHPKYLLIGCATDFRFMLSAGGLTILFADLAFCPREQTLVVNARSAGGLYLAGHATTAGTVIITPLDND
jgi:hypothetical protein